MFTGININIARSFEKCFEYNEVNTKHIFKILLKYIGYIDYSKYKTSIVYQIF